MSISIAEKLSFQPAPLSVQSRPNICKDLDFVPDVTQSLSHPLVTISGSGLMMSRLFNGHATEPETVKYAPELAGLFPTLFLMPEDRNLLAAVYTFANQEGADLAYVDDLAWSIAQYRRADNGREILPQRPLVRFDIEGHEVSYSFNEESAQTARRILDGGAISTTALDRGFLRFALDVDYSPMSSLNFCFLEQIVNKFSEKGEMVTDFGRRFNHFSLDQKNWIKNVSEEVYDLSTSMPFLKGTQPDGGAALATDGSAPEAAAMDKGPSLALREIIAAYLKDTGVPTLFETLRRMKR
jgi:hypothetical protein